MLAVGGIDYGTRRESAVEAPSSAAEIRGTMTGTSWRALPGTRRELDRIAALWSRPAGELARLEGPSATEETLEESLAGKRWVHLATHGFFQPDGLPARPDAASAEEIAGAPARLPARGAPGLPPGLLSGLVCAGANASQAEGRDNGLLTAAEIALLDLSECELAFLSACETALGTRRGGEGMLSVQRAFHAAGARTVIASLWSVGDAATAELVGLYYANLWTKGRTKLDALREAQLELLARARAAGDASGAPASWAAFVLSGDWR
jgi:CHAT domain-containing protein